MQVRTDNMFDSLNTIDNDSDSEGSSQGSEFVDDTQFQPEDSQLLKNDNQAQLHQNMQFLKELWANLAEEEDMDQNNMDAL